MSRRQAPYKITARTGIFQGARGTVSILDKKASAEFSCTYPHRQKDIRITIYKIMIRFRFFITTNA